MALLDRFNAPTALEIGVSPSHLRRCTFRRVTVVQAKRSLPVYDVACLYPDRETPIPLGDVDSARPICESCTAQGIFRPDSD